MEGKMSGDIFLKLEPYSGKIEGESEDSKHKGEVMVESFSWGASNATSYAHGTGGGVGKVQMQDINITKVMDKASSKMFLACCNGEAIKFATFVFRKAGKEQQEYLTIKLSDAMVSSITLGDHGGGATLAQEQVSFSYTKVEFDYKPQKADNTLDTAIKSGWDQKANAKV